SGQGMVPQPKAGFYSRACDVYMRFNHRGLPSCEGIYLLSFRARPKKDSTYGLIRKGGVQRAADRGRL
ncbi:hypothetical protein, partial [Mesorhizobium sp.]|uniref:hypothetical protein n=1 Tax=Mesorhizobium sp. TaxID=1871066 RepID=UPI0025C2E265